MPEMPPLPNFDTGQMPPPRTNGSQYGGISRAGASSGGRGMNAPGQGFSGPNSMPGMAGPNGDGWPPYGGSRRAGAGTERGGAPTQRVDLALHDTVTF